jgi:type IV pilus assembly protein PilE
MRSTKPFGFTLIELMIVVLVVAVLAAIALPMYTEHVRKGKRAEAAQALGDLQLRQASWRADNPTYGNTTGATAAAGNLFGSPANVTAYNTGLKNFSIAVNSNDATDYVVTATRKGDLTNDPKCANFVLRFGSACDATDAPGVVSKCMSDGKNVDYCWRQ